MPSSWATLPRTFPVSRSTEAKRLAPARKRTPSRTAGGQTLPSFAIHPVWKAPARGWRAVVRSPSLRNTLPFHAARKAPSPSSRIPSRAASVLPSAAETARRRADRIVPERTNSVPSQWTGPAIGAPFRGRAHSSTGSATRGSRSTVEVRDAFAPSWFQERAAGGAGVAGPSAGAAPATRARATAAARPDALLMGLPSPTPVPGYNPPPRGTSEMAPPLPSVRRYGASGPPVAVLHGGPGAPGYMAPVARGLADAFRVAEPLQRWSGEVPLTVAMHVEDTLAALAEAFPGERPALLGSSWGAMLALSAAAAAPDAVGPLLLVGCGTFDLPSRARFKAILEERTDDALRARLAEAAADPDPDRALRRRAALLDGLYNFDATTTDLEIEGVDARGNREAWEDMLRLQAEGRVPAAYDRVKTPVLLLHGEFDPHPGPMIRDSLLPFLPHLEYREFPRCGHYPWIERHARERFFAEAREWLASHGS